MYDITSPEDVKNIADELLSDKAFLEHDNKKNQGWRSGSLSHYVCFINARSFFMDKERKSSQTVTTGMPRQAIYYGAPGTGKSHEVNRKTKNKEVIRTTFHPDSDYSTFVGAYKPTTVNVQMRDIAGHLVFDETTNEPVIESRIVYEFVEQAFLQAYIKAWQAYAAAATDEKPTEQYLVIEEINRGNCAQIFGDLFQLLDRNAAGFSDYPIKADKDMKKQLAKAFKDLKIADAARINSCYDKDVVSEVLNGDILLLPDNLYIWATMNTSDQSLFPIDSAFKRRWDWKYMPICEGKENGVSLSWKIKVNGKLYDWWQFVEKINAEINEQTKSEDKKLGYFFCKAQNGIVSAETFVSKVIFYLWNDVFKDQTFSSAIFRDGEEELTFNKFYDVNNNGKAIIKEDKVELFLQNLGVDIISDDSDIPENLDELDKEGNNFDRYSLNDSTPKGKSDLGLSVMKQYLIDHPDMPFAQIQETFPDSMLGDVASRGLIVKLDKPLDSYSRYYTSEVFTSQDGILFRIYKQWTVSNIANIIDFAISQGWKVEKTNSWQRKDNQA